MANLGFDGKIGCFLEEEAALLEEFSYLLLLVLKNEEEKNSNADGVFRRADWAVFTPIKRICYFLNRINGYIRGLFR